MPPTNFGYLRRSANTRPVNTRSGEKTKVKSLPAVKPDTFSNAFAKRVRVVPTGRVVSYETNVPGFKPAPIFSVAASIQPKSGTPCSSTNSGTTTTTASDLETASWVSVVAIKLPFFTTLLKCSCR
ncbi:unannotated protein [freshwater metagenome]|uniref:Unannotated protein n=1 Tax=freshwater metagenome TaxID=449393 RepID=A0A6J7W5L7_9ZZZZ